MNIEELTKFLDDHKAELHEAVKARVLEGITERVKWDLPELIRKDVDQFYRDEIGPAVQKHLQDNKAEIMQVVIGHCVEAANAVASTMAQVIKENLDKNNYRRDEIFKALFGVR
jgi:hypothetical protein